MGKAKFPKKRNLYLKFWVFITITTVVQYRHKEGALPNDFQNFKQINLKFKSHKEGRIL